MLRRGNGRELLVVHFGHRGQALNPTRGGHSPAPIPGSATATPHSLFAESDEPSAAVYGRWLACLQSVEEHVEPGPRAGVGADQPVKSVAAIPLSRDREDADAI